MANSKKKNKTDDFEVDLPSADMPVPKSETKSKPKNVKAKTTAKDIETSKEPSDKSAIQLYLKEISKVKLLTVQEEIDLSVLIKNGDDKAREKMITANLRLVVKIAHDYSHFGLPLLDLISEGNIGLMKAVERFDPNKGGKLSTYAAWWIKQAIKRALANQSKTIRLPVHLVDKIAKIRKISAKLADDFGREPTDDELSMEIGIPVGKIAHLRNVSIRPTSLDAPIGDGDGTEFGDLVGDDNAPNPFDKLRSKSMLKDLNKMINKLDGREADIIRLRFGLNGEKPKTLEEVGLVFDITRERVRQLQNNAISKMRKILAKKERLRTTQEINEEQAEREKRAIIQQYMKNKIEGKTYAEETNFEIDV